MAGYDAAKKLLTVEFKGGAKYQYEDVPEDVWKKFNATFQSEDSSGAFFHKHIRTQNYKFKKLEPEQK